jgi:hypothetical protein
MELALCQRYCFDVFGSSRGGNYARLGTGGVVRNATGSNINIVPPVPMRVSPSSFDLTGATVLIYGGSNGTAVTSAGVDGAATTNNLITLAISHASGPTIGAYVFIESNNTAATKGIVSAEL